MAQIGAVGETIEDQRTQLIEIIQQRSYRHGVEIKLASGRLSDFYVNLKPTMMHSKGAYLIASLVLDRLCKEHVQLVGGLEMGAVPLTAAVAALSQARGQPINGFFVRKKAKDHGTQSLVEGLAPGEFLQDRSIVILEDVTTTGGSALQAVRSLEDAGARVLRVITVVDRLEGAAETFAEAGITFESLLTAKDLR